MTSSNPPQLDVPPSATTGEFAVSRDDLLRIFNEKYSRTGKLGWGPQLRLNYDYFTPDDYYEALVDSLLKKGDDWCDVGCGRDIFPIYPELAKRCADRSGYLLGIDPDDNIRDNPYLSEKFQGLVEDCPSSREFDLVTLRMVAEHIEKPQQALLRLRQLIKPSGRIVIYTPYKWAPMSILANTVPFALHNPLKRLLWRTEARDTFPTKYRMNTYAAIAMHARAVGLRVVHYVRLDDCRITNAYRHLNRLELAVRSALRRCGLPYPEACIIAVLKRQCAEATRS